MGTGNNSVLFNLAGHRCAGFAGNTGKRHRPGLWSRFTLLSKGLRGTKRIAGKTWSYIFPQCEQRGIFPKIQRLRSERLPTLGWGKQSVWLAASGSQTHFAGRSPHPLSVAEGLGGKEKSRLKWYAVDKDEWDTAKPGKRVGQRRNPRLCSHL